MTLYLKRFHRILYIISVFIFFLICFPVLYFFAQNPGKYYRQIVLFRRWISVGSAYAVGFRFEVNYESPIDWSKQYIICPNHTSILDITVLTYLCPQEFSFIGKAELLKNPITRIFFRTIDIPVNRDSKISAFKAYKQAEELVKKGKSIVIFPEGKIDDEYPPMLHPFKAGAFRMAEDQQVHILPVVIHNAWKLLWDDGAQFGSKPGIIKVSVLNPIAPQHELTPPFTSIESEVYHKMNVFWNDEHP